MPTPAPRREPASPAARAVEREVRENILRQLFGAGTARDLNLPADFVRRCADRVIISSFNERYRIVVGDQPPRPRQPAPPAGAHPDVQIIDGVSLTDRRWSDLPEQTNDVIRGFRFPKHPGAFILRSPTESDPYELRRAASLVARSLARNGLARTSLEAALAVRPLLTSPDPASQLATLLERAGIPLDLLAMFELPVPDGFARGGGIEWLAARIAGANKPRPASLRAALGSARLDFRATLDTFLASDDAGGTPPLMIRLQLTRADDWLAPGDGGSLDIARQVSHLLPATSLLLSARQDYAPSIARHAAAWSREANRSAPTTVLREGVTVSQWAQDNARAGTVARSGARVPAALLPRYASRADELSAFIPGDTVLAESLRCAGIEVARSPLHLQGGNAIVVHDAAARRRVLLIGEAEVYRNVALGLTESEVLLALRTELSADLAVILPAASYHIDYEVFCLTDSVTGRVTAFVGDSTAAEHLIVAAGIGALQRAGLVDQAAATRLRVAITSDNPDPVAIGSLFERLSVGNDSRGGFPIDLANAFTCHASGESPVGNFLTFLDALDACAARAGMASGPGLNAHAAAALAARQRLDDDRSLVRDRLRELGWDVVPVPSHSAAARSICPLNALRIGDVLLIPVVGGLFADLDDLARQCFAQGFPGARVHSIAAAESQRRNGAVRCAVSVVR